MLCQDVTKRKISSKYTFCSSKPQPEAPSSMPLWALKRHCLLCLQADALVLPAKVTVSAVNTSRFLRASLKYHNKGWPDSVGWGLSNWICSPTPPLSKMALLQISYHPCALWPYSGFRWKKEGEAEDCLPQITHQRPGLPLKWCGGSARLHHEAKMKRPMPLGAAQTDKILSSLEHCPIHLKVVGSIPGWGTWEATNQSLFVSLSPLPKVNTTYILGWGF